ncbi:MAG: hypothetical protein P4M10_06965 [Verrucomicrobiae bacterium]|nr:hypothetical protein [Verrucomicrobiae bacterium]
MIAAISALAGLIGVVIGGWLTNQRERKKRRTDFVERQLSEFYGPLLSIQKEIQALEELDREIVSIDAQWKEEQDLEFRKAQIKSVPEKIMPAYRQMVVVFRDKIWLAEAKTRPFFVNLAKFVDISERVSIEAIPSDVYMKLKNKYDVKIFYAHIEEMHDDLCQYLTEYKYMPNRLFCARGARGFMEKLATRARCWRG